MYRFQAAYCARSGTSLVPSASRTPDSPALSRPRPRDRSIQSLPKELNPRWQRSKISMSSAKIIEAGELRFVRNRTARVNISSGAPLSRKHIACTMVRSGAIGCTTRICWYCAFTLMFG